MKMKLDDEVKQGKLNTRKNQKWRLEAAALHAMQMTAVKYKHHSKQSDLQQRLEGQHRF